MKIKVNYADKSNYTVERTQEIRYIVIHYTANDGDTDEGNGNYFSKPNRNASAHYFVDEDSVTLSVAEYNTAWHCGAKSYKHKECRNSNSIGIEMCSKKDKNGAYYIAEQTIQNTAELTKRLMKKYSIPLENVLRHYDVTGKICPEPFVRDVNKWNRFKELLKESKKMEVRYNNINEVPEWGKVAVQKMIDKGCFADTNKLDLSYDMLRIIVLLMKIIKA